MNSNIELMEAYLSDKLSKEDHEEFESRLSTDKSFQEDFSIYKKLYYSPPSPEDANYIQTLEGLRHKVKATPKSINKLWLLVPLIILLLFLSKMAFKNSSEEILMAEQEKIEEVKIVEENIVSETLPIDKVETKTTPSKIEEPKETKRPKETKSLNEKKKSTTAPINKKVQNKLDESVLIAEADFKTNPTLESILTNRTRRSLSDYFDIIIKQKDLEYKADAYAKLELKGRIKSSTPFTASDVHYYLFDNNPATYKSFMPLLTIVPELSQEQNTQFISVNKLAQLNPGLYYYLIELKSTEELLFVGKFEIR